MGSPRIRYLLWDIDGTLLTTARAGVFALEHAAARLDAPEAPLRDMNTAGLTDAEIARRILESREHPARDDDVRRFLEVYAGALPERLYLRAGRVLDGVREVLAAVHDRTDIHNLLLTGNVEAGARAKLRHYDLDAYFDAGAFCVSESDRTDIARKALGLIATLESGEHLSDPGWVRDAVVVIGDTPHDVQCGKDIGARTIAVASGDYGVEDLRRAQPWLALERLPAADEFVELLGVPGIV